MAAPASAQPKLHSSTQKYKEKNATGAKGRAGGASLTARMLYAKDGSTELEATTGEFGSATPPPGVIWKMQVSALDALGVTMTTMQYRDPLPAGGYFKQTLHEPVAGTAVPGAGAHPHQREAQRHRHGDDERAEAPRHRRRPGYHPPPRAPVNMPVKMVAVVSELNGSIGARTDCVLYVNDVEADRAAAIWVDSGDSVSCAFSPTLTALGTNRAEGARRGVDPGDWDMANNVFEKEILVSTLTPEFDVA